MRFLFLIYIDEQALNQLSNDQMNSVVDGHIRYHREVLTQHSTILDPLQLEPTSAARTVRFGREVSTSYGPFAETEETLTGIYLLDCDSMNQAVEVAARYPMPENLGCVEVRPVVDNWAYAPSIDSPAEPATVWNLYRNVDAWPDWITGVNLAALEGPFSAGTSGTLTLADHGPLPFRIVSATPETEYVSETEFADGVVLRVVHTIEPLSGGGSRVTHRATVPRALVDLFGEDFSPKFNDAIRATLESLSGRARAQDAGIRKKGAQ